MSIKQAQLIVNVHKHNLLNSFCNNGYVYVKQHENNNNKISQKSRERDRERETERETHTHTHRQTDRQTDRMLLCQ